MVALLATDLLGGDQIGLLEHGEVFHHGESGDVWEERDELADGLAIRLEQGVEQRSPGGVGERPEDSLFGTHHSIM